MAAKYELILDDPSMYLDERSNPRSGRRLIFQGPDGTRYEVNVTMVEYANADAVKSKLSEQVKSHDSARTLTL